jgi:hypothetical protein
MSDYFSKDVDQPDVVFFEELPQQARLLLQAKNIQVEAEHEHTRCDCHCRRMIERAIISLIQR